MSDLSAFEADRYMEEQEDLETLRKLREARKAWDKLTQDWDQKMKDRPYNCAEDVGLFNSLQDASINLNKLRDEAGV